MFYQDFILTVERGDRLYFMTQLVTLLHEKHSQLPVALAFPEWQVGTPNRVDNFDPRRSHAQLGATLRLFSEHAAVLENAVRTLGIDILVRKNVLHVTPVKPVPSGTAYAAYCRVRSADSLNRRKRQFANPNVRMSMEDRVTAAAHTLAYFVMANKSGGAQRSIFFTKVAGESGSAGVGVNSFGFSSQSAPCFLPDF